MSTRTTLRTALFLIMAWSPVALAVPVSGQEVNSDVKIPHPRELVTGTRAINGLVGGTEALFAPESQLFRGAVAQASLGRLSEGETRDELGDFMTSLLVRAGIISFDDPGSDLAASGEKSEDGSRPAWTGPTPMAISVGRTRRDASARRR